MRGGGVGRGEWKRCASFFLTPLADRGRVAAVTDTSFSQLVCSHPQGSGKLCLEPGKVKTSENLIF